MATLDDQATEREELDREIALKVRRQSYHSPESATGAEKRLKVYSVGLIAGTIGIVKRDSTDE